MNNDTIEEYLKKCGWYKGRKIDTFQFIKVLKNNGYINIEDYIYQFYQEFYGLKGTTLKMNYPWKILTEDDIIEYYGNYFEYSKFVEFMCHGSNLHYYVKEDYFPICFVFLKDDILAYYITESNKIYCEDGIFMGNNPIDGLNKILIR